MKHALLLFCVVTLSACHAANQRIHVSPHGDDTHAGTSDRPLATLHEAQQRVRERMRCGHEHPIEVLIHPGVYELERPLILTPEDSGTGEAPITWRAADRNNKPTLSAGREITGTWTRSDRPGIWFVDVLEAKGGGGKEGWNFRQLFIDGQRATRARFPNLSEENPFLYANENNKGSKDHITIDPGLIKDAWLDEPDVQINLVVDSLFFNQWNTIAAIDKQAGRLFFTGQERHGRVYKNNWFYIEGILAELDKPGEWYLDRKRGRLYYIPEPGVDPNDLSFVAPRLDRIIHLKGDTAAGTHVQHVRFEHLDFRHTAFTLGHVAPRVHTDAAVRFENTLHCAVQDCRFQSIGGYAHWLHLDCRYNAFDRNTVLDSGGGGVLLTGARLSYMDDTKVYTPGEAASKVAPILNEITRNTVKHCGKIRYYGGGVHLDSRPANMAMLPGNRISNNHFEDLSRNGVFVFRNQGGNVIEYNHIHDAMQTTIDGACIHLAAMNYLCAPNVILNNWLYDIWGYRYLPGRKPRRVLANGVFLDWDTSHAIVKHNYVYNSGGEPIKAVWNNRNNTIEQNHTADQRIVPPFIADLGPDGKVTNGIRPEDLQRVGTVIRYDEPEHATLTGQWERKQVGGLSKLFTAHVMVASPSEPANVVFDLPVPEAGMYEVSVLYQPDEANASNVTIQIHHAEGVSNITWNMKQGHQHGFALEVGEYPFEPGKPAKVVLSNPDADGLIVANKVGFVLVPKAKDR